MTFIRFNLSAALQILKPVKGELKKLTFLFPALLFSAILYSYSSDLLDNRIDVFEANNRLISQKLSSLKAQIKAFYIERDAQEQGAKIPIVSLSILENGIPSPLRSQIKLSLISSLKSSDKPKLQKKQEISIKFQGTPDYEVFNLIQDMLEQPHQFGYGRIYEFHLRKDTADHSCCGSGYFNYQQLCLPQ